MPLEKQLKKLRAEHPEKTDEMIWVEVPKSRLRRPFPLWWALAALGLFALFALVTQLQFNRINNDNRAEDRQNAEDLIFEARLDTFAADQRAHDVAVRSYGDCKTSIETRTTYRTLFGNVAILAQYIADKPVELLPDSPEAQQYRAEVSAVIQELISKPVEESLKAKTLADCPPDPGPPPVRPVREDVVT